MTQGPGPSSRGAGLRPTRTVTRTPDRLGPTVGVRWRTVTVSDSAAAWQARSESVTVTVTVARPLPPGPGTAGTVTVAALAPSESGRRRPWHGGTGPGCANAAAVRVTSPSISHASGTASDTGVTPSLEVRVSARRRNIPAEDQSAAAGPTVRRTERSAHGNIVLVCVSAAICMNRDVVEMPSGSLALLRRGPA